MLSTVRFIIKEGGIHSLPLGAYKLMLNEVKLSRTDTTEFRKLIRNTVSVEEMKNSRYLEIKFE